MFWADLYKTKAMNINTLLYELTHSEWLMDLRYIHQLKASITKLGEPKGKEKEEPKIISFFNEDFSEIRPREIADIPKGSIAVINVVGGMMKYRNWYMQGADQVIRELDFANNLSNISAIVMIGDGPGGAVSAIPLFIEFAKRKRKPIVTIFDTSLSLHYWIPCAISDHMMASNTISSRFGSVGVVNSWTDLSGYWESLGIKEHEVYPEESKHKNEIWRKLKENEKDGKKMLIERHLKPIALKFQAGVKLARPNLVEAEGVLTGRTFGSEEALEYRMIDSIGTMQEAMQKAQMLAEISTYN